MPTQKPRFNVTFERETVKALCSLAKQERKSVTSLTKELVLEAMERREDRMLSTLAESRDTGEKPRISHQDAW